MITVELTYDMSKALGMRRFEVEGARTVEDVVRIARAKFADRGADFEKLTSVTAVVVNGVMVNHRSGMRTVLNDGDVVTFLKAAAGG